MGWGLAASFFTGIVPYVAGLRAIARGKLSSRHLPDRCERIRPMAGRALLILAHAPAEVLGVQVAMVSGAVAALAITLGWKISPHAGVVTSAAVCAGMLFGWWFAPRIHTAGHRRCLEPRPPARSNPRSGQRRVHRRRRLGVADIAVYLTSTRVCASAVP